MSARSLRRLGSVLRAALRGMRATPLVFVASVGTMTAGLLLLGSYLLLVQNMRTMLERSGHDFRLVAFLETELPASDGRADLAGRVEALAGVRAVEYVSSAAALERLRRDLGREAGILDGLEQNPLPASLEIEISAARRSPVQVRGLAERLERMPEIEEVRWGEAWVEGYARLLRTIEWLGGVLGGFVLLVLGAIVAGTVRLALHARAEEIEIQRLVGAGGLFVRLPFYLEGAVQGGVAAAIAVGILWAIFGLSAPILHEPLAFLLGSAPPAFFGATQIVLLVAAGVGLGVGGAVVSLLRLEPAP